jgi:hypothetical protein
MSRDSNIDDMFKELIPLILVFGEEKIKDIFKKYNRYLYVPEKFFKNIIQNGLKNIEIYRREDMTEIINDGGIELREGCLELDPIKRISAEQALNHRFFNSINNLIN